MLPLHPHAGQLYNLKSAYGNEAELVELNKALLAVGIRPGEREAVGDAGGSSQYVHERAGS